MKKIAIIIALSLFVLGQACSPKSEEKAKEETPKELVMKQATQEEHNRVLAAHEKRRLATLSGDADAVGSMMIDDLTFTHANAVVETKAQFVDALKTRRLQYKSLTDEDRMVKVHGNTGVVSGTCHILVDASGTMIDIRVRFTELWIKENEIWRMMLWHATEVK